MGVAGGVTVTLIDSNTNALIGGNAEVNRTGGNAGGASNQDVYVNASNDIRIQSYAMGGAGGFVGVAGAVDVGSVKNDTSAKILAGAEAAAARDVEVNSVTIKKLDSFVLSGAVGFVGVTGAVSVWSIGDAIEKNYSNDEGTSANAVENEDGQAADQQAGEQSEATSSEISSGLMGYSSDPADDENSQMVASTTGQAASAIMASAPTQASLAAKIDSLVETKGTEAAIEAGATVIAGDDIRVTANDDVDVTVTVGGVAGGFVGIGGSVAVTNIAANATAHAGGTLEAGDDINVEAQLDQDVDVVSLSGSAGFVGLGAAVVVVNDKSVTQAFISDGAEIISADKLTIKADSDQNLTGNTGQVSAGAVAIGASFVRIEVDNDSVAETRAFIGDNVEIGQTSAGAIGDIEIAAESNIDGRAETLGLAAGIGAATVNFAFVDLAPEVKATIGDSTNIAAHDIDVTSDLSVDGDAEGLGAAIGGVAVGAMIADVTLGKGNNVSEIEAGVGNNTTITGNALRIRTESRDDLFSDSTAGAGGVVGIAGAQADVTNRKHDSGFAWQRERHYRRNIHASI